MIMYTCTIKKFHYCIGIQLFQDMNYFQNCIISGNLYIGNHEISRNLYVCKSGNSRNLKFSEFQNSAISEICCLMKFHYFYTEFHHSTIVIGFFYANTNVKPLI